MKQALVIFLLFCALETVAQAEQQLSLDDCLELALSDNRQLELKGLEMEFQRQQLSTGKRYFVPEINAYARYFQYLDDKPVYVFPQNINPELNGPVQLGATQNFYSGITLNQHLFNVRMLNGRKLTNYLDELSDKRRKMSEDEIRYEVIKTFYQIEMVGNSVGLLDFNMRRLDKLEGVTQTAIENQAVLPITLEELLLHKEELQISQQEIENRQRQLVDYMKFLCGIHPEAQISFVVNQSEPAPTLAQVSDSASSSEMDLLQLQMRMNEEKILQETADSYPSLDFFMAFEWLQQEGMGDLFSSGSTWFNQHMIGLQLSIPLLNPNNRKSKIQENRINQEILSVQHELLEEKVRMERATARRDLQLARERLDLSERRVAVYEKQFHQETIRYEQEFSTLRETLEAEEKLRSSQMEMSQRKMDYFLAILELYRTYGNLESFNKVK